MSIQGNWSKAQAIRPRMVDTCARNRSLAAMNRNMSDPIPLDLVRLRRSCADCSLSELCLPAVGQGTLAVEARADNRALIDLLLPLEDATTRLVTEAERALLRCLQGSCRVPLAGHAMLDAVSGRLRLDGFVGGVETDETLAGCSEIYLKGRTPEARCEEARALGREVAEGLIARGAQRLMREAEAAVLRRERTSN